MSSSDTLKKLFNKGAQAAVDATDEESLLSKGAEYLGRPAAATRAAIGAAQDATNPLSAFIEQLQRPNAEAPTGADLADKVAESSGIENPYVLAGLATAADYADPMALIPGAKGATQVKKMGIDKLGQVGKFDVAAKSAAELLGKAKVLAPNLNRTTTAILPEAAQMVGKARLAQEPAKEAGLVFKSFADKARYDKLFKK